MKKTKRPAKRTHVIVKKTLASFLAGVFLFTNTLGWAQEERLFSAVTENNALSSRLADKRDLAPPTRVMTKNFQDEFKNRAFLLAHEATNRYIKERIEKDKRVWKKEWRRKRTEKVNVNDLSTRGNIFRKVSGLTFVRFIKITGLLSHTGQFAHVGFTEKDDDGQPLDNAMPVVYVDTKFYNQYKSIIQKHEIDEIVQWEDFRVNELGNRDRKKMRTWIKANIERAKEKAQEFHENAWSLAPLYDRIDFRKTYFDYGYISRMCQLYGLDAGDTRRVYEPSWSAGVHGCCWNANGPSGIHPWRRHAGWGRHPAPHRAFHVCLVPAGGMATRHRKPGQQRPICTVATGRTARTRQ